MATELHLEPNPPETATFYAVFWNAAGLAWNGSAFVTYTTTRDTFDVPMTVTPSGTGRYTLTMPALAEGYYRWSLYKQAAGTPSHSNDVRYAIGAAWWDGTEFPSQDEPAAGGGAATPKDIVVSIRNVQVT